MKIKNSDHRGTLYIYNSDFFEGVKVKFFRFISKQILNFVSLNTLVLETTNVGIKLALYSICKIEAMIKANFVL